MRVNAQPKRRQSRKINNRVILAVALFLVFMSTCVAAWYLCKRTGDFPIRQVMVQGNLSHVDQSQIVQLVQTRLAGSFFSLQLAPVTTLLLSNPWIKQVSFRRIWPDTLVVSLAEKQALARWGQQGVITPAGAVFYPDPKTIPKDLPGLFADDAKAAVVMQELQTLDAMLKPESLFVQNLFLSNQGDWRVILSNGIDIQVGAQDVLSRFARLMRVYQKLLSIAPRPIAKIDLRYPNGFAVTYVPPSAAS